MSENIKFETYQINELFDIIPGSGITAKENVIGNIPYISESSVNNGIRFFSNPKQMLKKLKIEECTLSISSKTGIVFFQKSKCIIGQQTHALKLKKKYPKSENIYLYLATVIQKQTVVKSSFGYQLSEKRLPFIKIRIPSVNKEPQWKVIESLIEKIKDSFNNLPIEESAAELENKLYDYNIKWLPFSLGELFNEEQLYSAPFYDENKIDSKYYKDKNIPYVTRTSNNNGVKSFLSENSDMVLEKGNCIVIGLDTQTINYQQYKFYAGQNIQIIRYDKINKYNALFLITIINRALSKFSWGSNGATLARLNRLEIMLPVDENNKPNWNYMKEYIKSLKYSSML